jgi:uncharacterized protein
MAPAEPPTAPGSDAWQVPRLRVDRNGDWYDGDAEVTHPGILANLRANLRRDSGGYFIQTRVRIPVEVEDAPYLVVRVEREGERLQAVLNDATTAVIDPATLHVSDEHVPYCTVKEGGFPARFNRAAAFQLLGLADYDVATGRGVLRLGGREFPVTRGDAR